MRADVPSWLLSSGDIISTSPLVCLSLSLIISFSVWVQQSTPTRFCNILILASTIAVVSGAQYGSPAGKL